MSRLCTTLTIREHICAEHEGTWNMTVQHSVQDIHNQVSVVTSSHRIIDITWTSHEHHMDSTGLWTIITWPRSFLAHGEYNLKKFFR